MDDIQAALLDQLRDSTVQLAFVLGVLFLLARFAKAQPTRWSFALIALPVPLLLLTFFWPWLGWVLQVYTPLLMLVLLVDAFFLTPSACTISLSRTINRKLSIGQENRVVLTVINNGGRVLRAIVRDGIPEALMGERPPASYTLSLTLPPYGHELVDYTLFPTRRGQYRFGRVQLRYRSRLNLLWMTLQGGREEEIKIIPDLRRMKRMRIQVSKALSAGELHKRTLGLEGTQFSGLRHYFAGDDIKKMAWQATAKLEQPVVRTFEPEVEQPILVLLDAGRKMDTQVQRLRKYDWALNSALAFIGVAIDRGDCVGAGVFTNRILASVPIGSGKSHLNRLLEVLAETEPQAVEPDYETVLLQFARKLKRRALVVIFTDLIDPLATQGLLRGLESFSSNHLVMLVTLSDSETVQYAAAVPETAYDAYRKGVALDLLEQRRRVLSTLSRSRKAVVIDAPPEALDEALIQRYLQLKQRNRL